MTLHVVLSLVQNVRHQYHLTPALTLGCVSLYFSLLKQTRSSAATKEQSSNGIPREIFFVDSEVSLAPCGSDFSIGDGGTVCEDREG